MGAVTRVQPKVPLAQAAGLLSEICKVIDDGGDIDAAIISRFTDFRLDVRTSVDEHISFVRLCKGAVEAAKAARDHYINQIKQLEKVIERLQIGAITAIKENPDIPFSGDLGKIYVQRNPPALEVSLPTKTVHISNTVDTEELKKAEVPDEFVKMNLHYSLNMEAIKRAITEGREVPWAKINQGEHLRIGGV